MDDSNSQDFIKQYFDEEQWNTLTEYEKGNLINQKRNYEALKSMGLNPRVPNFMLLNKNDKTKSFLKTRITKEIMLPLDYKHLNKEELYQKLMNTNLKYLKTTIPATAEESFSLLLEKAEKCLKHIDEKITENSDIFDSEGETDQSRSAAGSFFRYPKRNLPNICYTEEHEADEDLDRHDQEKFSINDLKLPLFDLKVSEGWDLNLNCPDFLSVARSGIKGAGVGIWTEIPLPDGFVFGPYRGQFVKTNKKALQRAYDWEVQGRGNTLHFVGGLDSTNWLWLVNFTPSKERQNLVAFQSNGYIYYKTHKSVSAFTELLVWYGKSFAKNLGIESGHTDNTAKELSTSSVCEPETSDGLHPVRKKNDKNTERGFLSNAFQEKLQSFATDTQEQGFSTCSTLKGHHLEGEERPGNSINVKTENFVNFETREDISNRLIVSVKRYDRDWSSSHDYAKDHFRKFEEHTNEVAEELILRSLHGGGNIPYNSSKQHVEGHSRMKPYNCPHCEYTASISCTLKTHINAVHVGLNRYKCPHCEYRAATSCNLTNHVNAVHDELKSYKCPYCECRAASFCNLKEHVNAVHDELKSYKCPHCEHRTVTSSNLKSHVNAVHVGLKPYKCPHCEYRATRSYNLKSHVNAVHVGLKPYKCPHCEHRAASSYKMKAHVNSVHVGLKPYKCPHCEYRAASSRNLKNHVNAAHDGLKPYKCPHCEYSEASSYKMKDHVISVHADLKALQ